MFAPNTIIENLLQQKKAQAAMVLDAMFATDANKLPNIEISGLLHTFQASGIAIGESIVRKGLFDLARLGLLATRRIMTRAKGRPRWEYRLGSVSGMAQILGVKLHINEHADSIPHKSFKSTRAFRAAKHYSFIARLGVSQLSRKKLGARLGVNGRSTLNYEIDTNIKVEQRVERTLMKHFDIALAPEKRLSQNLYLEVEIERDMTDAEMMEVYRGFDESILLIGRRKTKDTVKMPYTRYILQRELERGHTVILVKQITNEYSINAA